MSIVERAVEMIQSETKAAEPQLLTALKTAESRSPNELLQQTVSPELHTKPPFDAMLRTTGDVKPFVRLDIERLRELHRLPPATSARQTQDEIRRIKWPLLSAIAGSADREPVRNNVILITSAMAGEGKTFVALNLALSIAGDRELQVILVDGDVVRPGLTQALDLGSRPGLIDALEDLACDIDSVTYQTDIEGLLVVPAGRWNEHSSELLAGSRMPQILAALVRRVGSGVVILDSPPLLATNDAQVASRYAGQALLVVRAEETEHRAVRDAIALIDRSASVSAVLNQVRPSVLSRYYGGYHYGYGPGHRDGTGGVPQGERSREAGV